MRRRIVEVNKAEVRRFRPETVNAQPPAPGALAATLGERAIARQLQSGRRAHDLLIGDSTPTEHHGR
jgi:hypothetical protein